MQCGAGTSRAVGLLSTTQLSGYFLILSTCAVTARRIFARFVPSYKRISEDALLVTCCKKQHFSGRSSWGWKSRICVSTSSSETYRQILAGRKKTWWISCCATTAWALRRIWTLVACAHLAHRLLGFLLIHFLCLCRCRLKENLQTEAQEMGHLCGYNN